MIKQINDRLLLLYGKEPISGMQKYRVVRSNLITEKRYGKYDILTQETGIWLGVKQGLVEIKKYWYLKDCWLLERVEPNLDRKNVFYDKYTYEPIFPFLDKDDNELPLSWRPIELLVGKIERAVRQLVTEKDHAAIEEKRLEKEEKQTYGILDKPDSTKPLPTFEKSTLLR